MVQIPFLPSPISTSTQSLSITLPFQPLLLHALTPRRPSRHLLYPSPNPTLCWLRSTLCVCLFHLLDPGCGVLFSAFLPGVGGCCFADLDFSLVSHVSHLSFWYCGGGGRGVRGVRGVRLRFLLPRLWRIGCGLLACWLVCRCWC